MAEEIIIDKEDKTKKHRNNEIDCLHFCCRKGESGNVLFWCDFYDDHCDNYTGCYYRKYLRLEQENKEEKKAYTECMHYLACMTEQRNKLKTALEEIRNYCNRIEQGSVIGTQDCLINSIKNIINEVL